MHVFHLGTHADVVPGDERTRHWGERSTTPNRPKSDFAPKTWCPATKEQGIGGSEAPRLTGRSPILSQRRGVRRRKNKVLRGAKHHVQPAESDFAPKTWCPATKEQGIAGSEAPRPTGRNPILLQRRGARRRKNKALRGSEAPRSTGRNPILLQRRGARRRKNKALGGAKHHAQPAEAPFYPKDVVPDDGRTRFCGERSTTPNRPKSDFAPKTWCP